MWELDYKESRAPKSWCFWTVVLEKTLESPLAPTLTGEFFTTSASWEVHTKLVPISSVQFSRSVVSDSLRPHESQHARAPCPWLKFWSFSFSIIPYKEHPGLISFRMDWLDLLQSKGLWSVFSNTTVQKNQFFRAQLYSQSNSHIHTWLLEKP